MEKDLPKLRDYLLTLKQQKILTEEQRRNLINIRHFIQIIENSSQYYKFQSLIKEINREAGNIEFICHQQNECESAIVGLVKNNSYDFKIKEITGDTVRLYLPHFNGFTEKEKQELKTIGINKVKIFDFQMKELVPLTLIDNLQERDLKVNMIEEKENNPSGMLVILSLVILLLLIFVFIKKKK